VPLEPKACREQFARHLADETTLLQSLESQLQREHELLRANDIEALEQASSARQQSVARLLRVHEDRSNLCRARKLAPDATGFRELLAWCDPDGSLAEAQIQYAIHAQRCREQNERNGALVAARLNRVGGMLGMVDSENTPATYQARSAVRATTCAAAGRMLSTRA
jgi:flagellar biosynthesis/type III secretory pathway chaperone